MEYYIRPIEKQDARGVHFLRISEGSFENTLGLPSERLSRSEEIALSTDLNRHQFVAVTRLENGQELVIGMAGMSIPPNPRAHHCGMIGISIHRDYQDKGVGTALLSKLIDLADNWLMLVRLELGVFTDNVRAIHLYEKLGFEKEGIKRKAAVRNGKYMDEFIMARLRD